MKFRIIFICILISLTFTSCGYKWEKKRYSMEKQLEKLEKQSNEKINHIMDNLKE